MAEFQEEGLSRVSVEDSNKKTTENRYNNIKYPRTANTCVRAEYLKKKWFSYIKVCNRSEAGEMNKCAHIS